MIATVERLFYTFYDNHIGRISIYPHKDMYLVVNLINLLSEASSKVIHVTYPNEMKMYEATNIILNTLTYEYGETEQGFRYSFRDYIWDPIKNVEREFTNTEALVPCDLHDQTFYLGNIDSNNVFKHNIE